MRSGGGVDTRCEQRAIYAFYSVPINTVSAGQSRVVSVFILMNIAPVFDTFGGIMTAVLTGERSRLSALAERLCSTITDAHSAMTRSKAELLAAVRMFDQHGFAEETGARTTAQFLTRRLEISNSTAHEYVHVAHRLGQFPYLEQHFAAAALSYSVVRLLLKYMTKENERELVDLALDLGYHALEVALSGRDRPGEDEHAREYYMRVHPQDNGDITVHGRFNASDGAAFMAALKLGEIAFYDMEDKLESALRRDDDSIADYSVDEMLGEVLDVEPAKPSKKTASGYGLPVGRMLLDSFMGMVHSMRTRPTNALTTPGAHVNVLMTTDGRAHMPNNVGARSETLTNLIANADLRVSTVDNTGLIINTGRRFRLANAGQVNALLAMWGGQCAAPECTHSRFIEIHHIKEWADGGMTDLENLLPLCSACHSLVTDGYLETVKDGADIHFVYLDGTRYVSENYSMPRRRDDAVTWAECGGSFDDDETA